MARILAVAKLAQQHWLSQGLRISSIKPEALTELKRLLPQLSEDYIAFLRVAGLPEDEDGEGFRFWPPQEVRPTAEVLTRAGYQSDAAEPSAIIADYLQESWWYGLWLTGPFAGHVSLVLGRKDGRDPQPPLEPFVDFMLAYLHNDARLYPPKSGSEHPGRESK